jgi:transposase
MDSQIPCPSEIWEHIPPEAQAYIRVLENRVAMLEATVRELREQVQQTSRTSSRPPSSDPPQALGQRPRRGPTGRRPGGQPGPAGGNRRDGAMRCNKGRNLLKT